MVKAINIKTVNTPGKGGLSFFEAGKDIPFEIKRIYYIHDVPENTMRGAHAHKELKQLLFCPCGSVKMILDDGNEKTEMILDSPDKGLILTPCIWRDFMFLEKNTVLCVAVSEYFDETDYIRSYDEFLKFIKK